MFHRITIVGNLGNEPIMKYTPDGKAVTTFSVAASNKKDETTWFRVSVWGNQAESCNQYLHKGSKVLVECRLKPDTNGGPRLFKRTDGTMGASFEVHADYVRFLDSKSEAEPSEPEPSDDIPF